jgi:hypothetical protein
LSISGMLIMAGHVVDRRQESRSPVRVAYNIYLVLIHDIPEARNMYRNVPSSIYG